MTTGIETNYLMDGKQTINIWDDRYDTPMESYSKDSAGVNWVTKVTKINALETEIETEKFKIVSDVEQLAVTTVSKFDLNTQTWQKIDKYRYDKYGINNKALVQKSVLSIYGRLINAETIYADGINRNYVPIYDANGSEIGGKGYKFDILTKKWIHEFDYLDYSWDKGELTRTKLDLLHGKKKTIETIYTGGLTRQEIDKTVDLLGEDGKIIGQARRVIKYIYNGVNPLVASTGKTVIEVNIGNNPTVFIPYSESMVERIKNNIIALKLKDVNSGRVWYENKDIQHRNRSIESYQLFHDSKGRIIKQLTTNIA